MLLAVTACGGGTGDTSGSDPDATLGDPIAVTNDAPVISGTPPAIATSGHPYSFQPTASDPDGDTLRFSVKNAPDWTTFDANTGRLSGTPPIGATTAAAAVVISVSDGEFSADLPGFTISITTAATVNRDQPRGIYSIDTLVDRTYVDGLLVRPRWSEMEPVEGQYDFSKIDAAVRAAAAAGKGVSIASLVNFAPEWLRAKSTLFDHRGETMIVPWDETMLEALERLVQAQAAHQVDGVALRDHPSVLQVNASIGGMTSIRVIDLPPGFETEKYMTAVERAIGYWDAAYPTGKHLYVGLFGINDGARRPSTGEVLRERLLSVYNGTTRQRLHFFQELLTGRTPQSISDLGQLLLGVEGRSGVMFQACGPWTEQEIPYWPCNWVEPLDTPELGLQFGLETFGSVYFEIYNADLENDAYRPQFETWRARIDEALAAGTAGIRRTATGAP